MSQKLGRGSLVLALSESTINYQLMMQWKTKHIHNSWGILVRKDTVCPQTSDNDPEFDDKLQTWQTTHAKLFNLFQEGKIEEFNKLKNESQNLLWDFGWSAKVQAPTIKVIENDPKNLQYIIQFKSGNMYTNGNTMVDDFKSDLQTYPLDNCTFAFTVPLRGIEINNTSDVYANFDAQKELQSITKFDSSQFTISGLFLDFDNANISNFDPLNSKFPEGASPLLIANLEAWFRKCKSDNAPKTILGYSIVKTNQKDPNDANVVFKPTDLMFSTSFSKIEGKSSLNYVMVTEGSIPKGSPSFGIIDTPILERLPASKDDTSIDGVLAIYYPPFHEKFVRPVVKGIEEGMEKQLGPFPPTPQIYNGFNNGYYSGETVNEFTEKAVWYKKTEELSVGQNYKMVNQDGTVHLDFKTAVELFIRYYYWNGSSYELKTNDWISTNGKGSSSVNEIILKLGQEGAVTASMTTSGAVFVNDKDPTGADNYRNWDTLIKGINDSKVNALMFQEYLQQKFDNEILPKFGSVIANTALVLPFGKIYTYRDLYIQDTVGLLSDRLALCTIGYAPTL